MEIKLEELLQIVSGKPQNVMSGMIGRNVFIRSVTFHYIGKVEKIVGEFVELSNAAWIADSGRFSDALKKEDFSEVEPYPNPVWINVSSIVDFTELNVLKCSQK